MYRKIFEEQCCPHLVHLRTLPDVDLEIVADEGEERGGEGNPPLLVYGHVHPDEALVGHLVRTLLPEPERRINVLQHLQRLGVVDLTPAIKANFKLTCHFPFISLGCWLVGFFSHSWAG